MNRITILQPSYIPWIGYFDQINRSDIFIFFDDVLYTKNDWRNRNRIKTAQGACWLTIPVDKKNRISHKLLVKEAKIIDRKKTLQMHVQTIHANYRRAKYFDEVFPIIENILNAKNDSLSDFTINSTKEIATYLGINHTKFYKSSELKLQSYKDPTDHLIKICKMFHATNYLTGDSAKEYLSESLFRENSIILEYHNYKHPKYNQLWGEFMPYLSIIDLLFNEGKRSLEILSTANI